MDYFNYMVLDMLTQEAIRERLNAPRMVAPASPKRQNPVKRALASSLVRLGLRLDPAAGEGLASLDLPLAQAEARS